VDHSFGTMRLPGERDAIAPDGSCVRVLLRLARGSMAHFELGAGSGRSEANDREGLARLGAAGYRR
jgi:hypothetical protein